MIQTIAENWDKVSSILLSIIAICIALISSRQTSKQASKQIEEIQKLAKSNADNADRQVESIKRMSLEAMDSVKKQMISMRELAIKILEYSIFNLEDTIRNTEFEKGMLSKEIQEELEKINIQKKVIEEADKVSSFQDSGLIVNLNLDRKSILDKRLRYLEEKHGRLITIQEDLQNIRRDISNDMKNAIEESKKHGTYDELFGYLDWPYKMY